jgi:hypothetical protein
VDRHYLTPLFDPRSIVVFAGDPDAEAAHPRSGTLRKAMADGQYKGVVTWLDIGDDRHAGRVGPFACRPGPDRAAA